MSTTVINIKTEVKVKKEAQKITADLGLSLSAVINGFLKQLVRDKTILFTLNEKVPSDYLLTAIKDSKKERKAGKSYSFKNSKDAVSFLDKQ